MSNWRELPAPTHRCNVCGALWRYWPKRDVPGATEDSWNMRSNHCGKCCDTAPMAEQIVPVTEGDMLNWLQARLSTTAPAGSNPAGQLT